MLSGFSRLLIDCNRQHRPPHVDSLGQRWRHHPRQYGDRRRRPRGADRALLSALPSRPRRRPRQSPRRGRGRSGRRGAGAGLGAQLHADHGWLRAALAHRHPVEPRPASGHGAARPPARQHRSRRRRERALFGARHGRLLDPPPRRRARHSAPPDRVATRPDRYPPRRRGLGPPARSRVGGVEPAARSVHHHALWMAPAEPTFTIGLEEEYLLVDRASRDVPAEPPATRWAECQTLLTGQVSPEFLRSQIEGDDSRLPLGPGGAGRPRPPAGDRGQGRRQARAGADRRLDPSVRPVGTFRSTPTRSATTCSRATSRGWRGACSSAGLHVHVGIEGRRGSHRSDEPGRLFPAPSAGAQHVLAVLARREHRPDELSAGGVRRTATRRPARPLHQFW